jgi:putative two-component system response regulator
MRILIVDDDEISLEMLANTLAAAGHEVETAGNGREALERLALCPCRMVISDWDMPELNGIELCQRLRDGEAAGYVYVILLTSHDGTQKIVEGMSAGADDFISKPFAPQELLVRIRAGERVLALETRDMVIFALAKLAESRDADTGAHLERVRCYSRVLATQLSTTPEYSDQIDGKFIQLLYLTSPLHDIGKVGIPDSVLLKPGRLTEAEFEIMKHHSVLGADTLDAALEQYPEATFLRMARDIAASHHERFDGTGYPNRLFGKDIPLCGRIVAVADVYDALTSKRTYKEAYSHEVARDIIVKGSGTHFDPEMVEAFLAIEDQFVKIRERYADEPDLALVSARG